MWTFKLLGPNKKQNKTIGIIINFRPNKTVLTRPQPDGYCINGLNNLVIRVCLVIEISLVTLIINLKQ